MDEVARKTDRAFVSGIVREFVQRYRQCRCVVTSRIAAYQDDARIEADFRVCTVADLSADQQQRFIANWSRSLYRLIKPQATADQQRQEAERYTRELWEALEQNEQVRGLAVNPLLLTVICVIYYNNYVLPEDRAALYEECVEVLLRGGRGKADRAGQQRLEYAGTSGLSMGLNPKRELLAAVAYTMHQRGEDGQLVSRDELIAMVADHLHHQSDARDAARSFVDELPVHIGLLDEREPDRFAFSHLSFQEFLAARHVAETDRWSELLDHYSDPRWREVILLCAGHLSRERCWRFLGQLIDRGSTPSEHAVALELATAALVELERFKGQGPLADRLRADALAIVEAPDPAVTARARVTGGIVLARVGDPRPGVYTLPPSMIEVGGGAFVIGLTAQEVARLPKDEQEYFGGAVNEQPVTVRSFALARYPVTNAQFKLFMEDHGYDPDAPWWERAGRAWRQRDDAADPRLQVWQQRRRKDQPEFWEDQRFGSARPNHPVVGISWYEAQAFCRWLTQQRRYNPNGIVYRLPTEAEWEWAARGPERRMYPWGREEPEGDRANYGQTSSGTTAVGCFPGGATPEGVLDLAGNVWEWTCSVYGSYPYDPGDGREQPTEIAQKHFTLRGGSWFDDPIDLRSAYRLLNSPGFRFYYVGFRLATHLPV
ncbi:MAG: SUMF1/EgtB/PvdO family nonheme iron enzyme [Herpetosiphonaceae bacterium]|nr:SUMF1/EgtB/PvdO family nonheme iron enzyme [Herpetosiphonaceae bacterium]